jgi:hypothetical protein
VRQFQADAEWHLHEVRYVRKYKWPDIPTCLCNAACIAVPTIVCPLRVGPRSAERTENKCPEPTPATKRMSPRSEAYQRQITELESGLVVRLNGIRFDGCRESDGTMLEVKGRGYAEFIFANSNPVLVRRRTRSDQTIRTTCRGRPCPWTPPRMALWPDGHPFYVGKGLGQRVLEHEAEARNTTRLTHKLNVIRSLFRNNLPIHYRLDSFFDDEMEALARERLLIQTIGRHDLGTGPLTNQTDGGEGTSNPSEESRQRRRESLWGDAADPERLIANNYFRKIAAVQSVTLKPTSTWRGATALRRNRAIFNMSARQAATLVASAIQNRVLLEPDALIPRRLQVEGSEFIIENGVGNDMLSRAIST